MSKKVKNPFEYAEGRKVEILRRQRKEIKDIYRNALQDIEYKYGRLEGKTSIYAENKKLFLDDLRREYERQIEAIGRNTETVVLHNMREMADAVLQSNQIFLNGVGYREYINNPAIRSDVINRIATGQIYGEKWSLSSAIWGNDKSTMNEINKIIAKGVAEGQSLFKISKQLERYVNPDKLNLKSMPGVRTKVDYNAQRLARTMVQHAYQESFVEATLYNPFIEAYRWVTSGGHNVCELCNARASEDKYGLGEGIFPKDQLPLDHPNGQCTFEPVFTMSEQEISDTIADWYVGECDPVMDQKIIDFANYLFFGEP